MTLQHGPGMSRTLRMFSLCLASLGLVLSCLSTSAYRISVFCVFVFLAAFLNVCLQIVFSCVSIAGSRSAHFCPCVFASLSLRLSPCDSPSNCPHLSWCLCISLCLGLSRSWAQAIRLRVHPLYLMIPGTVGCSYAFMLPVSTPPNSIAFASGHLLVKDMVSLGYFQAESREVHECQVVGRASRQDSCFLLPPPPSF